MKYANLIAEPIPQSEPLDERQVANNAGGFVFQLDYLISNLIDRLIR
jgi:60 kDa SS-A/Ro ribonucleoprotein